ncbi:type II secretion system F family protein [Schaalia sp. ZJ405]|uniref:type II secretion system F family protein n=1 Tax=Schaalia sp. ZJ405 TaxID=2709403 RepID=UPI0013EB2D94|nr:type II secretion system F family protein [Schaalia sp. ZJ405]QPK80842.1 type II secretion system F family protein [Schaalia sp. ZJ405]
MIGVITGALCGVGIVLIVSTWVGTPTVSWGSWRWVDQWRDRLVIAGWKRWSLRAFVVASIAVAVVVGAAAWMWSSSWTIGGILTVAVLPLPFVAVSSRARRIQLNAYRLWPDVVDGIIAGVRAGIPIADILGDIADSGPEEFRPAFAHFRSEYAVHGRLHDAMDVLKGCLAHPVADRIVETLRIACQLGGADLVSLLRAQSVLLREDARIRGELRARQSWTVNSARLGVAAPWVILLLTARYPGAGAAWNSSRGAGVLLGGLIACVIAFWLMRFVGRMDAERRTMR